MDGQIEKSVKAQRVKELSIVAEKIRQDFLNAQIGKTLSVLIETRQDDGMYLGYTANYTPVKVIGNVEIGKIVNVTIKSVQDDFCIGE